MSRSVRRRRAVINAVRPVTADNKVRSSVEMRWIVVIRESAVDLRAFMMMVHKVIANLRFFDVPGLDEAQRIGASVFTDQSVRDRLKAEELRRPGARPGSSPYGYVFWIEGTCFVFAQVSARDTSEAGENSYTRDLVRLVTQHRFTHLGSGPTTRICRHRGHVASLNRALENAGSPLTTRVVVDQSGGKAWNLRVTKDKEAWDKACADAERDYHSTRDRLASGIAGLFWAGEYARSEASLPVGYTFVEDSYTVRPDPGLRPFIAEVVAVSAASYLDEAGNDVRREWSIALEKVIAVADKHGWASAELKKLRGPNAKFSEAEHPAKNAERLWKYLLLWRDGKFHMRQKLNLGLDEDDALFYGAEVRRVTERNGTVTTYLVGSVDFGSFEWNPEELALLEAAIERRSPKRRPKGQGGRKLGKTFMDTPSYPLLGLFERADGEWQYKLVPTHGGYNLVRRPVADAFYPNGARRGWGSNNGEIMAAFQSPPLHRSLASAGVKLIDQGGVASRLVRLALPLSPTACDPAVAHRAGIEALASEIGRLVKRASIIRTQETDALVDDNAEAAADFKAKAAAIDQEVVELRAKCDILRSAQLQPTALASGTTSDVGEVAVALAALAATETRAPQLVQEAVARFLTIERINPGLWTAEFVISMRVPTSGGTVALGPGSFHVLNTGEAQKEERLRELLRLYFVEGLPWWEIAAQVSRTPELIHGQVRKHLTAAYPQLSPGGRTSILQCPVPDTRRVVWSELGGEVSLATIPPAWVRHVKKIYLGNLPPVKNWAPKTHAIRRGVVDCLLADATDQEEGLPVKELARATGYSVVSITNLIEPVVESGGRIYHPSYERVDMSEWGPHRAKRGARIRLRMCPWCQTRTATHVLHALECPDDLICTTCRRTPSDPDTVFPAAYMERLDGGKALVGPGLDDHTTATSGAVGIVDSSALVLRRRRTGVLSAE